MKSFTFRSLLVLGALLALTPTQALGDPMEVSYSWSYGKFYNYAFGQGDISLSTKLSSDGTAYTVDHGNGSATFTLSPAGTTGVSTATPVLIPIGTLSSAILPGQAGTFGYSADFALNLQVTAPTGETGTLALGGSIIGDVTPTGSQIYLSGGSVASEGLTLGDTTFTVAFTPTTTAMIAVGSDPVLYQAELFVNGKVETVDPVPSDGNPEASQTPEPSSLLLGSCALVLCGARALRRRFRRS